MYRQGDVLIKDIDRLPDGLKKQADDVLVYGESTGHAHRLKGGSVFLDKKGAMFLMIADKGFVVHEEHKPITLKKGAYAVIRQREYTMDNMTKLVVD